MERTPEGGTVTYPWTWCQDRVDQFRKLYAEGLTHSVIAKRLGVTRNASIGKAARLGLPSRAQTNPPKPALEAKPRKPKFNFARTSPASVSAKKKAAGVSDIAASDAPPSLNLSIIEIGANQCRYPYGDRAPFQFCGHEQHPGSSYCPSHHVLCERPA